MFFSLQHQFLSRPRSLIKLSFMLPRVLFICCASLFPWHFHSLTSATCRSDKPNRCNAKTLAAHRVRQKMLENRCSRSVSTLHQCAIFARLRKWIRFSRYFKRVSRLEMRRVIDMGTNRFTAVSNLIRNLSHQRDGSNSCWPRLEVSAITQIMHYRQWDGAPGHERPLRADRRTPAVPQETPPSLTGVSSRREKSSAAFKKTQYKLLLQAIFTMCDSCILPWALW